MKKRNKLIVIILLIILLIIAVKYIYSPERRVKNFVINNNEKLVAIAEAYLSGDTSITTYKGLKWNAFMAAIMPLFSFTMGDLELHPLRDIMAFTIRQMMFRQSIKTHREINSLMGMIRSGYGQMARIMVDGHLKSPITGFIMKPGSDMLLTELLTTFRISCAHCIDNMRVL